MTLYDWCIQNNKTNLLDEWDAVENGELAPHDVTPKSNKKVFWICKYGHKWSAVISSRSTGSGCPFCAGKKAIPGVNDLETCNPILAAEWHPTKNGNLTPHDVSPFSSKKVWWKCVHGHEWLAAISCRSNGTDCPYCAGNKVLPGFNDMETRNPTLSAEWHPTKNGELTPKDVTPGSKYNVWWLCQHGHEWMARVADRNNGNGCPYCAGKKVLPGFNDLKSKNPWVATEWHPTKNLPLTPENVTLKSSKEVWWKCSLCGNEWQMSVSKRSFVQGCPKCAKGRRVSFGEKAIVFYLKKMGLEVEENIRPKWLGGLELDVYLPKYNIGIQYDGVAWHQNNKNDLRTNLRCRENGTHLIRIREPGCDPKASEDCFSYTLLDRPSVHISCLNNGIQFLMEHFKAFCNIPISADFIIDVEADRISIYEAMKLNMQENSLATQFPKIAAEWNYEKNGTLLPQNVLSKSQKMFWWKCVHGHEWMAKICNRSNGAGCPICAGKNVLLGFNDLGTSNPILAAEWHPTKNGKLTPKDITLASGRKVWWKCSVCKHEWQTAVNDRKKGNGCPECGKESKKSALMKPKPGKSLAEQRPELSKEWHPTKNGDLTPNLISVKSGKKVWWLCQHGHEWVEKVVNRNNGCGCPYCSGHRALPGFNDLETCNPTLAAEWHPTKNGELTPKDITPGSNKKAWWQCSKCMHEWLAAIHSRTNGTGCPKCYELRKKKL